MTNHKKVPNKASRTKPEPANTAFKRTNMFNLQKSGLYQILKNKGNLSESTNLWRCIESRAGFLDSGCPELWATEWRKIGLLLPVGSPSVPSRISDLVSKKKAIVLNRKDNTTIYRKALNLGIGQTWRSDCRDFQLEWFWFSDAELLLTNRQMDFLCAIKHLWLHLMETHPGHVSVQRPK